LKNGRKKRRKRKKAIDLLNETNLYGVSKVNPQD